MTSERGIPTAKARHPAAQQRGRLQGGEPRDTGGRGTRRSHGAQPRDAVRARGRRPVHRRHGRDPALARNGGAHSPGSPAPDRRGEKQPPSAGTLSAAAPMNIMHTDSTPLEQAPGAGAVSATEKAPPYPLQRAASAWLGRLAGEAPETDARWDSLDRLAHAQLATATGGISPASLAGAYADWAPGRRGGQNFRKRCGQNLRNRQRGGKA